MTDIAERIYDQHAQALYSFLLNILRNEADARDVLQEVFCKIIQRPGLLRSVRDERHFLLRLAHNLAVDFFRRQSTRQKNYAEYSEVALFAETSLPDEAQLRETLSDAIRELPAEQSTVVHLKLWEGATFEEIGALLGIPANTAASRYRYAIDKLRTRLRPIYDSLQ
jgi:RNA polymerase sigma-70 factor, ECF subfamily